MIFLLLMNKPASLGGGKIPRDIFTSLHVSAVVCVCVHMRFKSSYQLWDKYRGNIGSCIWAKFLASILALSVLVYSLMWTSSRAKNGMDNWHNKLLKISIITDFNCYFDNLIFSVIKTLGIVKRLFARFINILNFHISKSISYH